MKKLISFFLLILLSFNSFAQFEDIFSATKEDANKFISDYTQPLFDGLISASNAGWFTTAEPLKPFRVELNISGSAAFAPAEDEIFTFNEADYNYLKIDSGSSTLPTLMGEDAQTRLKVVIPYENDEYKVMEFDAPDGVKEDLPMNAVPAPAIQLSMGLPLGSELSLRYLPEITDEDGGYVKLFGLGIKHSLTQYFPAPKDEKGNKTKRHFNLSAFAAFQNIAAGYHDPDDDTAVDFSINTITMQGIASFDYKIISLYSSIGVTKGFSSLDVLGTYNYTYVLEDDNGNVIGTLEETITDPLELDYDMSGMNAGIGVKLKLFILTIYADYTIQKYPVAHAGVGLKF